MADFSRAFEKFYDIKYSNRESVLHYDDKKRSLRFYGVCESSYPLWIGWGYIYHILKENDNNLDLSSQILAKSSDLILNVQKFYIKFFWKPLRLDLLDSQKIAEEMFFFYIQSGDYIKTIKIAQLTVKCIPSGKIDMETILRLNSINDILFDKVYQIKKLPYHISLLFADPCSYFTGFLKGNNEI